MTPSLRPWRASSNTRAVWPARPHGSRKQIAPGATSEHTQRKENNMSSLSDSFRKLADQIDQAETNVKAASSQRKAELQAKVNEARGRADKQSAELHAKAEEASDRAGNGWQQIQDDWNAHVARARQRV